MIGILSKPGLLRGLKLSNYYKLSSSLIHHLPLNPPTLVKETAPARAMCKKYIKPISAKHEKLQTLDGVPLSYDLIYVSHDYHTVVQHLFTALPILFVTISSTQLLINFDDIFPDPWTTAQNLWITTLFLYVNIGTAFVTYKSPVRIYHNKETDDYKAIFNDFIPTKIRILEFAKGSVQQIPPSDPLTIFRFSRYKINGQKLFMHLDFFRYPNDLYNMLDKIEEE